MEPGSFLSCDIQGSSSSLCAYLVLVYQYTAPLLLSVPSANLRVPRATQRDAYCCGKCITCCCTRADLPPAHQPHLAWCFSANVSGSQLRHTQDIQGKIHSSPIPHTVYVPHPGTPASSVSLPDLQLPVLFIYMRTRRFFYQSSSFVICAKISASVGYTAWQK